MKPSFWGWHNNALDVRNNKLLKFNAHSGVKEVYVCMCSEHIIYQYKKVNPQTHVLSVFVILLEIIRNIPVVAVCCCCCILQSSAV